MRLTDILTAACVKVPLAAADKRQAIDELADLLAAQTGRVRADQLKAAAWQREQTRTTGIGHGVAIPHGKCDSCQKLLMAVGKTASPIDFNSVDKRPVELIFLLASPVDQTGPHIQALASISRMLADPDLRASIRKAASSEELFALIAAQDGKPAAR